ncbi:squalene synthetase-like protein, partial [Cryomyces antarcticus]
LKLPNADEWDSTDEAASEEEKEVQASAAGPGEWGPTELDDLQELSTSEEAFGIVRVIIRKRERRPGRVQYLVVHEGDSFDDAKWRPMDALTTEEDMELIRQFEAEVAQFNAQGDAESEADTDEEEEEEEEEEEDSDQADLESSLDGDERERWLDEEDLR